MISPESLQALYATTGGDAAPPVMLAVLTCMDPRLQPEHPLGMTVGDVHIIRNAGGRATDDAVRSLIVAWNKLDVDEFVVIHHTDCRMMTFTDEQLRQDISDDLGIDASSVQSLCFTDLAASVRADVERLQESPFVPVDVPISGFICDTVSGQLQTIVADPASSLSMFSDIENGRDHAANTSSGGGSFLPALFPAAVPSAGRNRRISPTDAPYRSTPHKDDWAQAATDGSDDSDERNPRLGG